MKQIKIIPQRLLFKNWLVFVFTDNINNFKQSGSICINITEWQCGHAFDILYLFHIEKHHHSLESLTHSVLEPALRVAENSWGGYMALYVLKNGSSFKTY